MFLPGAVVVESFGLLSAVVGEVVAVDFSVVRGGRLAVVLASVGFVVSAALVVVASVLASVVAAVVVGFASALVVVVAGALLLASVVGCCGCG
jgi:hypothetical protein